MPGRPSDGVGPGVGAQRKQDRVGDDDAAKAFQALQLAYEVLRAAEERREWKG